MFNLFGNKKTQEVKNQFVVQTELTGILSALKDGIVAVDSAKNIVLWNLSAQKMFGLAPSQVLGHSLSNVLSLSLDNKDITQQIFATNFSQNGITVRATGGKSLMANITANKVAAGLETGVDWIITIHDVSSEKELEDMKMGFVSIAAHELRTPLTSIKGYLSVFNKDYKDKLNDDEKDLLAHAASNTDRVLALVENLLNVSRIERGALSFNPEAIDYVSLVGQIVSDFQERASEKNIQLKFDLPTGEIPQVKADKVRISEVLSNLIANAINYTNPGGNIEVFLTIKGQEVWTSVADNGPGIPKEAIDKLFTKFFRVTTGNNSLTQASNSQGNGLGLYISKAIVNMHKGNIWVESEVGIGTRFTFSLPV